MNENGQPVTCGNSQKQLFEYSKAKNICGSLPKTIKKLNFFVEALPDISIKDISANEEINTYEPSENVYESILGI